MDICIVCVAQQGQKAKPGQSGQRSTDKVERKEKNSARGMDICVVRCRGISETYTMDKGQNERKKKFCRGHGCLCVCVVSKRQKTMCRTIKKKKK
jgi:hypothetical protein